MLGPMLGSGDIMVRKTPLYGHCAYGAVHSLLGGQIMST